MPFNLFVLLPFKHGVGSELRSVVTDHHAGVATPLCNCANVRFEQTAV
jgi:hypothetical protein